ncbi:uncharacterized protein Bfra_006793, partial [Botrytis fragariae]
CSFKENDSLRRAGGSGATSATVACYGANHAFKHMSPTKPCFKSHSSIEAIEKVIESTTFVMLYRNFQLSWQILCAASVYSGYSIFCKQSCTRIFDDCKREWDRIKVVDEAASNLETREKKSLGNEDSFVEDTTL